VFFEGKGGLNHDTRISVSSNKDTLGSKMGSEVRSFSSGGVDPDRSTTASSSSNP